jgi:hypothetical protein
MTYPNMTVKVTSHSFNGHCPDFMDFPVDVNVLHSMVNMVKSTALDPDSLMIMLGATNFTISTSPLTASPYSQLRGIVYGFDVPNDNDSPSRVAIVCHIDTLSTLTKFDVTVYCPAPGDSNRMDNIFAHSLVAKYVELLLRKSLSF